MNAPGGDFLTLAEMLLPAAGARTLAWSRELCRHVDQSGHDCAAYHGIWPYILRFGMAHPPQRQRKFYRSAVADAGRRILASGAADYSLPATLLWAYAQAGVTPAMTLTDIFETPLRLSAWFAEQAGVKIETVATDILAYRSEQPYDVIAAHSFLGYFAPEARGALVAAWRNLLAPGGRVVLVHRVRAGAPDLIRFNEAQTRDFRAQFLEHAAHHTDELPLARAELEKLAEGFVAHSVFHPLRTTDELTRLFEANGFRIASLRVDPVDPLGPSTSPGPTLAGGVEYANLIAIRR